MNVESVVKLLPRALQRLWDIDSAYAGNFRAYADQRLAEPEYLGATDAERASSRSAIEQVLGACCTPGMIDAPNGFQRVFCANVSEAESVAARLRFAGDALIHCLVQCGHRDPAVDDEPIVAFFSAESECAFEGSGYACFPERVAEAFSTLSRIVARAAAWSLSTLDECVRFGPWSDAADLRRRVDLDWMGCRWGFVRPAFDTLEFLPAVMDALANCLSCTSDQSSPEELVELFREWRERVRAAWPESQPA